MCIHCFEIISEARAKKKKEKKRKRKKKKRHFLTLCYISESLNGLISYSFSTYHKVLNGKNYITATAQILADKVSLLHLYRLLKKLLLYRSNN